MSYIVNISIGRGLNRTIMQSTLLPNKIRVREYIRRNPAIKSNTNVKVTNTITRKSIIAKPYIFTSISGKFQRS